MKIKLFAILDKKAQRFAVPFPAATEGIAVRMFHEACRDPETSFNRWPADFALYEVGTFDDEHGTHENVKSPLFCASAEKLLDTDRLNTRLGTVVFPSTEEVQPNVGTQHGHDSSAQMDAESTKF